ncbi:MAG TPA: hypothetical protein VG433_07850 [Pirellulales bacterium]|jgi:hypothetical protein|nr:hypothetical protein [Pirellulales bacterium]
MATVHTQGFHEEHTTHAPGSSVVEAAVGLAGVLLAILGLVNVAPAYMASIATLAIGAALAFRGAAPQTRAGGNAISAEFTAGLAGIVLGILAILGIESAILISVAVLVFSGGLLLSAGSTLNFGATGATAGSGSQILCGVAGIVLGIIALVGSASLTLCLVALLTLGAAVAVGGNTWSHRFVRMWQR